MTFTYYDFFAGGGMAGVGLGPDWSCSFANDIDPKKAESYRLNHNGGAELTVKSVASVTSSELPAQADLVWASFPCQDLSLAGKGAGLAGKRSGMFNPFWDLMSRLAGEGRAAKIVALENVSGVITSNSGRDFETLSRAFGELGYRFGALVVDAVHFLPQSRPRFFMVGVHNDLELPKQCVALEPHSIWHPKSLVKAQSSLPGAVADHWNWWNLETPPTRNVDLSSLIEDRPRGVKWHTREETQYILSLMTELNRRKVKEVQNTGLRTVGTVYRRTRPEPDGVRRQRAEVRFDQIAGCLRTPSGGSSRQTIMLVEGSKIKTRLLSPREAAALMGLPGSYILPERYNDAYKLAGDGVAAPVVRYLADNIFEPILRKNRLAMAA